MKKVISIILLTLLLLVVCSTKTTYGFRVKAYHGTDYSIHEGRITVPSDYTFFQAQDTLLVRLYALSGDRYDSLEIITFSTY